jgi:predicted dehydrogenase
MRDVRIALIGCGYFGRLQLKAWQSLAEERARLVAVCDRDADLARRVATELGLRWYDSAEKMLAAEAVDLVDIATRMDTHRSLVELTIGRRIATIVQKPMAPAYEDCVAMVRKAAEAGVFLAVHENFRFQRPMRRIKEIIGSGEIGEPSWARIGFRTGIDVYRNQPYFYDEERLVILDLGVHILDLCRYLLGEVRHVSCETQRRNGKVRAEDTATMLLRHESGAVSLAECTYENRRSDRAEVFAEIEAERGGIELGPDGLLTIFTTGGRRQEHVTVGGPADEPLKLVHDSIRSTCLSLLEAFQAGKPAETSGADNLRTFALVEAAYEAARSGTAVAPGAWA